MIFDTNAISALADGDRRLAPILKSASLVAVPAIVLGEFQFGIRQSRKRPEYEGWLASSLRVYSILNVDAETARIYAEIRLELKASGRPIPSNDLWIAALARLHQLPVVSLDAHFDSVTGLKRVSW